VASEVQELIMRVVNGQAIEDLSKLLRDEVETIRQLRDANQHMTDEQFASMIHVRAAAQNAVDYTNRIKELEGKTRSYSQGIQALSYALQDATSVQGSWLQSLNAVQNNIPGILMGLGLETGLAAKLSMVAVGLQIAIPLFEKFGPALVEAFQGGETAVSLLDQLEKKVKELEGKKVKIAVDVLELQAAKDQVEAIRTALQEVEKLRKSQEHYEKQSGQAIDELFAEAPGGGKALSESMRTRLVNEQLETDGRLAAARQRRAAAVEEEQQARMHAEAARAAGNPGAAGQFAGDAERAKTRQQAADGETQRIITEISKRGGSADQTLGGILNRAKTGSGRDQAAAQQQLQRLLSAIGRGDLAESVGLVNPDNLMDQDQADDAFGDGMDHIKEVVASEKRKRAKVQRTQTAWEASPQGRRWLAENTRPDLKDSVGLNPGQPGYDANDAARKQADQEGAARAALARDRQRQFRDQVHREQEVKKAGPIGPTATAMQSAAADMGIAVPDATAQAAAAKAIEMHRAGASAMIAQQAAFAQMLQTMSAQIEQSQQLAAQARQQALYAQMLQQQQQVNGFGFAPPTW
jgi:hypothetical protein